MVVEVKPIEEEPELWATRVFLKTLDILGGLKNLAEFRALTWLSSLARAAIVIVLREVFNKTEEEIAEYVGVTRDTVKHILHASPEEALAKAKSLGELSEKEREKIPVHMAGGLTRKAFELIKNRGEEPSIALLYASQTAQALDIPWAYAVLKRIKGIDFPVENPELLRERLTGLEIKDRNIEDLVERLEYPISSPAELLHKIKKYSENKV